jgi:flagellar basal-body rod protein FlgC
MSIASVTAVSGMKAASLRLQVSASNVANVTSSGPLPDAANAANFPAAYTPLRVDQTQTAGGGTQAIVSSVTPPAVFVYDPTSPFADSGGMVAGPNVDLGDEIVQQMIARYSFAANAQVVRSDSQMTASLLNITA